MEGCVETRSCLIAQAVGAVRVWWSESSEFQFGG